MRDCRRRRAATRRLAPTRHARVGFEGSYEPFTIVGGASTATMTVRLIGRGSWAVVRGPWLVGSGSCVGDRRESFESAGVPSVVRPLFFVPPRSVARGSEPARRSAQSVLTRKSPCALSGNDPMRRSFPTEAKYAKFDETQNRCSGHAPWMVNIEEIRRLPPWKPRRE